MSKGPDDPPDDPLLLFGPRPERKGSLLVQIVSSLLIIGGFILAIFLLID